MDRRQKERKIQEKFRRGEKQGRPIVSACSCPTELISSYLDKIMAPIVKTLPSYMKDSHHVLEIFRDLNFLGQNNHYGYYISLYCYSQCKVSGSWTKFTRVPYNRQQDLNCLRVRTERKSDLKKCTFYYVYMPR